MFIYIYNFISIIAYGMVLKNKKFLFSVISLQLFLILACRDITVGYDLENYRNGFLFIGDMTFWDMLSRFNLIKTADLVYPFSYESGYMLFNWIIGALGLDFHDFLIICSAINIVAYSKFIYRYSNGIVSSFLIFFGLGTFLFCFGILRQSLALSILILGLEYILKKDYLKTFLVIFIAFLFHRSAVLFIPLLFLANMKIQKVHIKWHLIGMVAFSILSEFIFNNVIVQFLIFFGKFRYIDGSFTLNNLLLTLFILEIAIFIFVDTEKLSLINNISLWGLLLAVPLEIVGCYNDGIARAVGYYTVFLIVLLPNLVYEYGRYRSNRQILITCNNRTYVLKYIVTALIACSMFYLMINSIVNTPMDPYIIYFD